MLTGLYGAGFLGRRIGREIDTEFVFVDDTPSKLGAIIDGHKVTSLELFSRCAPSHSLVLYVCIYQPGFSYLKKRAEIRAMYPELDVRPFTALFHSAASGALPYLFFESPTRLGEKLDRYEEIGRLLNDDLSRSTLSGHLAFRITGQFEKIVSTSRRDVPFLKDVLSPTVTYVDAGAYDGDTTEDFVAITNGRFGHLCLVEPDAKNICRAEKRLADLSLSNSVTFRQEAISDVRGLMGFNALGSVGSSLDSGADDKVKTSLLSDFDCEGQLYIKLDIEGAEIPAISASIAFIASRRPILAISVYHRPDDLLEAVKLLQDIEGYAFYVRCHGPAGEDLMLYAIPN
ncbi:FkbM family methyltransferase [Paraburkholderia silvatlantica]|uniref:FkbM family methyltransferase n=1 Tax=Paraburkholderia silvatlantica TaxID=321895 RepID=A0A2V4UEQ6_9BURK|nr:FkbM family methyltransferase [Paraburkholderia silvatlantica]PYE22847.1 FkbM family methyltransferase [Paraburkholderia silvatlantica]